MTIANVALTDTFDYWRTVTNSLVYGMNHPLVYFGSANANTISITQNASREGNVYINVMTSSAMNDFAPANIASMYSVNTVLNYAVSIFNYANATNAALTQNVTASFARTNVVSDVANAAYNQANAFSIVVSNTKPVAVQGSVWWHNELGKLFVYYKDGDTDQWVDTSPAYDVTYIEDLANGAYDTANTAKIESIASYAATNTVYSASNVAFDVANSAFGKANTAGGAQGAGPDSIFYLADQAVTTNYSIPTNKNAMAPGPLQINTGVTVTINVGTTFTIV